MEGHRPANMMISDLIGVGEGLAEFAYLCISRVCVEHVGEEFACTSYTGDHQAMNVKAINDKKLGEAVRFALGIQRGRYGCVGIWVLGSHAG